MSEFDFVDPEIKLKENLEAARDQLKIMLLPVNSTVRAFAGVLATELKYRIVEKKLAAAGTKESKDRDAGHHEALLELSTDLLRWIAEAGGKQHGK